MTRVKYLLTALAIVAIAFAPAAFGAATVHVVGAGSSAQFLTAALGADSLAESLLTSGFCPFHYTAKTAANLVDNRDGAVIRNEPGNLWIVWIADCSDATGNTGITDIWTDISVDSTVGNRAFLAQLSSGSGVLLSPNTPPPAAGNLISPQTLWPDGNADVAQPSNITSALTNVHVNVGLTDIRPEDALYATARAYNAKNNCTGTGACTELGYSTANAGVGAPIESDLGCPGSCSSSIANPVDFALSGPDPFTGLTVRNYTTVPIGAAPIIFVYNNNGEAAGVFPTNLVSGITPGTTTGTYLISRLFDGTTACAENNPAFGGSGSGSNNINVALREPLSGTMNTTEFSLFRSDGDTKALGSQEWGFNPQKQGAGYTAGANYNPLDLDCASGGKRVRGVGTGEITKWVNTTANTLGYIFWGFANANSVTGVKAVDKSYNYMTIDDVDPIGIPGAAPYLPYCGGPCPATLWPNDSNGNINSFPNVRNGTYKAWSLYRWLVPSPDTDPVGPTALATATQKQVDVSYADYVPFVATSTTAGTDPGLSVYHSHSKYCKVATVPCPSGDTVTTGISNGSQSGNTLGGGTETGSDVGGYVYGPFPGSGTNPAYTQVATQNLYEVVKVTSGKATVTKVSGEAFSASMAGETILLDATFDVNDVCQGTAYTIKSATASVITLTTNYSGSTNTADHACVPPLTPGTLNKHQ